MLIRPRTQVIYIQLFDNLNATVVTHPRGATAL